MANSNTYIRDGFVSAGSAQITGSLGVTGGITGSLKGTATTASYVLQAVSASYAPSAVGAIFPFTGSAIISGSLTVIGSTAITGSIRISSPTSSISTLTLINSGSVANPARAPLLMFSSSAASNYLINSEGSAFYVTTKTSGFSTRSEMGVGGLTLHNAASTPSVTSPGIMNITSTNQMNFLGAGSHRFFYAVYIGAGTAPTAMLHLIAGTAAASTAPLKLTSGTNLTTPEAGAIEFNGNSLFFTTGSTRSTILTNTNPASITGNVSVTGNLSSTAKYILGSDLSLIPISGNQSAITTWWGMQLVGNKQSTVDYTPSAIGNNSDFSVIIPNQQAAKIGLIVRGQTSQTGNLLELRNVSNTGLSAFDSTGQLALGKATPTATLDVNGNAIVSGSLTVTGSFNVTGLTARIGNTTLNGNLTVTGSLLVSGSSLVAGITPIPLAGTIKDGVTSVLGNLNDWDSNFYQGTVLYSEIAGGTITFGQLCYRTNAETWALADATAIASSATHMLGICVKSSTATNPTSILINGFVETTNYATILKSGEPLYMATTAGSITKTAPTTAGNIVRLIGNTFWDSNLQGMIVIHFNPDRSWIELT